MGDEIRFDLLDESGEKFATGLAKVAWVNPARGMGVSFLAIGIDPEIVASLVSSAEGPAPGTKRAGPPPLPGVIGGPPPLPGEHLQARAFVADPFATKEEDIAPQIEPLAVRRTGIVIGIDLGTTNTCASYVVDGRPKIIPGRTGTNTIPSMITFDPDGTWYVGQRAADRQILHPTRTVYGTKRLVGRTYKRELAAELQQHFAYPLGEAESHRFGVRLDNHVISMDTIAARVLDEVRSTAQDFLKCPVEAAVITVPAYFSEMQREAVRRAAREANLVVHRIVNEPTAAAVAYGHKLEGKKARIAVWDFGGGTFDFSIVKVSEGQLEVLLTAGDNFVGGSDFDDQLAAHLLAEFKRIERVELDPTPQQIARLRTAAEIAKRALSVQEEYLVELPEFSRDPRRELRVDITRAQFDDLTKSLIDRTIAIATEVMEANGLSPKEVDDVLLVGGTTRIPAVQHAVEELFGRRPSKRINPDEAVALGAALLADEVGTANAPILLDILPMSVGYAAEGCVFKPIVLRNARLPAAQELTLDADFMGSVTMPLFQGESPDVGRNEYLCTVIVEDRTLWENGRVIVNMSFDEHCVMAVEARDARTGCSLPARLDRTRSVEDILRELGAYTGPANAERPLTPPSRLGAALGKLFSLFGR